MCHCIRLDLQNEDRVNCNQKQYASPGGQPRDEALLRSEKMKSDSQKKIWGKGKLSESLTGVYEEWSYTTELWGTSFMHLQVIYSRGVQTLTLNPSPSVLSLLPKHRVQYLNNNLKAISFFKDQILAIFCSLVSKEKHLSFQTSGITYLGKPPVLKPSNQDGSL